MNFKCLAAGCLVDRRKNRDGLERIVFVDIVNETSDFGCAHHIGRAIALCEISKHVTVAESQNVRKAGCCSDSFAITVD